MLFPAAIPAVTGLSTYVRAAKIALVVVVALALAASAWYIKQQSNTIDELTKSLAASESVVRVLNSRIRDQNASLARSEQLHDKVQTALNAAAMSNNKLSREFGILRAGLAGAPVPANCEEARDEMVRYSKEVTKKWAK